MSIIAHSEYNRGVSHIFGFYSELRRSEKVQVKHFVGLVEGAKHKLIQITLREDQLRPNRGVLVEMHKLGFVPVYCHVNPNTNALIHMFVRKPDLPKGFKAEVLTKWEAFKYKNEDSMRTITLNYHKGGCCGYSDVFGFSKDKDVLSCRSWGGSFAIQRERMIEYLLRRVVLLNGEIATYFRPGMAHQMFVPNDMYFNDNGPIDQIDVYLEKAGFEKVYSYLCPTNKTKMNLVIASSNKREKGTWEEISHNFSLGLFDTKKEEGKNSPVETKGYYRDEYGRFASRPKGLGTGDMVAVSITDYL